MTAALAATVAYEILTLVACDAAGRGWCRREGRLRAAQLARRQGGQRGGGHALVEGPRLPGRASSHCRRPGPTRGGSAGLASGGGAARRARATPPSPHWRPAWHLPARRLALRAIAARQGRYFNTVRALRPRRPGTRPLPQDPSLRCRLGHDSLPRVRSPGARRRCRAGPDRRGRRRAFDLLRPAFSRALSRAGTAWCSSVVGAERLHGPYGRSSLGGAAARSRHRERLLCGGAGPGGHSPARPPMLGPQHDRRSVGHRPFGGARRGGVATPT